MLILATAPPSERLAQLLARSIGYDKNLKARVGERLSIGLVHSSDAASAAHCLAMDKAFTPLRGVRVQGVPIEVLVLPYSPAFAEDAKKHELDVIYVCPNFGKTLPAVVTAARKLKLMSIASDERDMTYGLVLGTAEEEGRIVLLVDPETAKATGIDFADQLLGVAKLVHAQSNVRE